MGVGPQVEAVSTAVDSSEPAHESKSPLLPHVQRSSLEEAWHFFLCATGILACYFYFGYQQEVIVKSTYEGGERFTYTQALVFFLCVTNTILAYGILPRRSKDTVPLRLYGLCSLSYVLAMIFSNQALQYLPYPTQVLGKSCKPIPVMVFGRLFAGKHYTMRKYFFVLMTVIGVGIFLYKEKKGGSAIQSYGWGEALLLLSLAMDGCTSAVQDFSNKRYQKSPQSMMFWMNLLSSGYLLTGLVATGEIFGFLGFVQRHPHVFSDLLLIGIASAGGQYFIFKTINEFSPLTCSILTTTRKLFTILISVAFVGHDVLSQRQYLGTALVFAGLFMDSIDSQRSKHHHQKKHHH